MWATEESLTRGPRKFWNFISSKKVTRLSPSSQQFSWGDEKFDDGLSYVAGLRVISTLFMTVVRLSI